MIEDSRHLPGEGSAVLPVVPLQIEAFVESVEQAAIEDLVETFQKLELMLEHEGVALVVPLGDLDYDRSLFDPPKNIEDSVRNHHHIGVFLIGLRIPGVFSGLVHVPQHLLSCRSRGHLQVPVDIGLLLFQVFY